MVTIGSGTPADAERFARQLDLKNPLVTDPTLEAFRRAGMKRGVLKTIGLQSIIHGIGAMRRGFKQSATKGDPWQQGGIVVVSALARGGTVTMQHASGVAGEPTDFSLVVQAVGAAAQ
ncbi:MAG: hypothetical protein NVS3B20_11580 [Polyangiales bacterium]